VDIDAGDRAVELIRSKVRSTYRPEVVGDIGGFAGLFALDTAKYTRPMLASSTDGVGTKLVVAQQMDIHDTVGIDLVAMVVDDLVVCGAEPLFLLDYVAIGEVVPDKIADLVGGISDGCRYAGCSLVGGVMAAHPGSLAADEYDISATGIGIVEAEKVLSPERVLPGDILIALGSSGLHSNGYSLARHVLFGDAGLKLDSRLDELGDRVLGEELLVPTSIYARHCLMLLEECTVRGFSHITGGGIADNLRRALPKGVDAVVDRSTWRPQPIFDIIAAAGAVETREMERTFNMGVGMIAIVPPSDVDHALSVLAGRGVPSWVVGEVLSGNHEIRLVGRHPR
jgi:phosphoribosylformylglycinamidine cyclo-ligase